MSYNIVTFLGPTHGPWIPEQTKEGSVFLEIRGAIDEQKTLYISCRTCRYDMPHRIREDYTFFTPRDVLKHLADHQLANHTVDRKTFDTIHGWLSKYGNSGFGHLA